MAVAELNLPKVHSHINLIYKLQIKYQWAVLGCTYPSKCLLRMDKFLVHTCGKALLPLRWVARKGGFTAFQSCVHVCKFRYIRWQSDQYPIADTVMVTFWSAKR